MYKAIRQQIRARRSITNVTMMTSYILNNTVITQQ